MVFAPNREIPIELHEPAATPKRLDHVAPPNNPPDGATRLQWRAVVRMRDRESLITTWHMAGCAAASNPAAHCPEGQRLIEKLGDPDGHCLIDGKCSRCQ